LNDPGVSTINDLKRFRKGVVTSKQFADDPNAILDSVLKLIDQAVDQVKMAAQDNEGKDDIWRGPPAIDDPIDDPRVTSPRELYNKLSPISSLIASALRSADPKNIRVLAGRIADTSRPSPFETGAPAVPFIPPNGPLAPARSASNDPFMNWQPSPSIAASPNSDQQVPQSQAAGTAQRPAQSIRVLSSPFFMPNGTSAGRGTASAPGISGPQAQSDWPPATRPVPEYPVPPMVYGLPDPSDKSGDNMDDWFKRWIKPLMQQ
jgi:hypothetical protein